MKAVIIFNLTTLFSVTFWDNIYEAQTTYFILAFMINLIPIIISLISGFIFVFIFKFFETKILLFTVLLFIFNELSFGLFEKRFILFGLVKTTESIHVNPIDNIHYVFISVAGLIGLLMTNLIYKLLLFYSSKCK